MWQHFLHVYQKPKAGTAFLNRYAAYNYRHKISAVGGFDTASCDISIRMSEPEKWLDQHIGNTVAVYVDDPLNPIWEGFINRLTFSAGNYQYTISLDEMFNRMGAVYTSGGVATSTTLVNNTDSQAIYGIKEGRPDAGVQSTATITTSLRDTILAMQAWPKASIAQGGGSGLITVEMLGFYHTLSWEIYNSAAAGTTAFNTFITATLLPAVGNGTTFFDNADTSGVSANSKTALNSHLRGQTIWQILQEIQEAGDGTQNWVMGISPTQITTGTRIFYYRAASSTIDYTARRSDGLRIRNVYGMIERPWFVRPDKGIRIADMLPGWNGQAGSDPRETWISGIDYDANRQEVSWTGADDITTEGAFQLSRMNRMHGTRFGAERRLL